MEGFEIRSVLLVGNSLPMKRNLLLDTGQVHKYAFYKGGLGLNREYMNKMATKLKKVVYRLTTFRMSADAIFSNCRVYGG